MKTVLLLSLIAEGKAVMDVARTAEGESMYEAD